MGSLAVTNQNLYPRESVEFQPVAITVNGTAVLTGVTFSVVEYGLRPSTFGTAVSLSGNIGVMVSALDPGDYTVWAKIVSSPETPVVECGYFTVT